MGAILSYTKDFLAKEFNPGYFLTNGFFLAAAVFLNYHFDFERQVTRLYYGTPLLMAFYFLFYAVPFLFSVLTYAYWYKKYEFLRSYQFWILSLYALLILSFNGGFFYHIQPVKELVIPELQYFVLRCMNNLNSSVIYFVLITAYWIVKDRREMKLYGFQSELFDFRPFLHLLLLALPFIILASFQGEFLQKYPRYTDRAFADHHHISTIVPTLAFEFFYGLDFISTEFFFRGFMVLAFMRFLGRGAVFPMVTLYAFLHFEKPLAEAVSSIFGGLVLGIISYSTRSIYGGIMVHLGVAWMMEIAAFLQMYRH